MCLVIDGSYEERVYVEGEKSGEAKLVTATGDIFTFLYKVRAGDRILLNILLMTLWLSYLYCM